MKCDTINTVLTYVLGALALLGVVFALQTIFRVRELRSLQVQAAVDNANIVRLQQLASEAFTYNQSHPSSELTRIFQTTQAPAAQPVQAPAAGNKPATR